MSKRGGGWKRQSWQDAEREIGQAVGLTVQASDQVVLIPDAQIDDSPYQARAQYADAQIADLAQGMRESGFQAVLFVRAHPEGPHAGRPRYQLVFGHRRRRAWRAVCAERGVACELPVILRAVSDRQLLTIGAQENLQRADLNPVEEAQLVVWHQEIYFPASLGEIGRMLGKSEDWAKARSRVAQLPEPLKEAIRRGPQLMTGMLELSRLWEHDADAAMALAAQAEREGLNLKQIRLMVAEALSPDAAREEHHERRVNAPNVNEFTDIEARSPDTAREEHHEQRVNALSVNEFTDSAPSSAGASDAADVTHADHTMLGRTPAARIDAETTRMLHQLQRWEILVADPAQRDLIGRSCERLLHQIQQLVGQMERGG